MTAMLNAVRVLTDSAETGAVTMPCRRMSRPKPMIIGAFSSVSSICPRRPVSLNWNRWRPCLKQQETADHLRRGCSLPEADALDGLSAFHIPFAETQAGKSAPSTHPFNPAASAYGQRGCQSDRQEADLRSASEPAPISPQPLSGFSNENGLRDDQYFRFPRFQAGCHQNGR